MKTLVFVGALLGFVASLSGAQAQSQPGAEARLKEKNITLPAEPESGR